MDEQGTRHIHREQVRKKPKKISFLWWGGRGAGLGGPGWVLENGERTFSYFMSWRKCVSYL